MNSEKSALSAPEVYVLVEGKKPTAVIIGRDQALNHLAQDFRLTFKEQRMLDQARESFRVGQELRLVGYEVGLGGRVEDRVLTRVRSL